MAFALPAAFRTGIESIDREHDSLVDIINAIGAAVDANDETKVLFLVRQFRRSLVEHFRREERIMEAEGFPGVDGHRNHHQTCVAQIDDLLQEGQSLADLIQCAVTTCFEVLISDVARKDLKFQEYMEGRPSVA